ncbi:MAG: hypothetical protein JWP97_5474 [Labilithrix sp.]|nr:hypothetical protein [Labilithrix sp.]
MSLNRQGIDGRFWAFVIMGTLTATTFGCFASAMAAQTTSGENASILSVNDALHQMELRQKARAAHALMVRSSTQHEPAEGALVAEASR